MVTLRLTRRENETRKFSRSRSKIIARPEVVWLGSIHKMQMRMEGPSCSFEANLDMMHQYRNLATRPDRHNKTRMPDYTMLKFQDKLVVAMQRVLHRLQIIELPEWHIKELPEWHIIELHEHSIARLWFTYGSYYSIYVFFLCLFSLPSKALSTIPV